MLQSPSNLDSATWALLSAATAQVRSEARLRLLKLNDLQDEIDSAEMPSFSTATTPSSSRSSSPTSIAPNLHAYMTPLGAGPLLGLRVPSAPPAFAFNQQVRLLSQLDSTPIASRSYQEYKAGRRKSCPSLSPIAPRSSYNVRAHPYFNGASFQSTTPMAMDRQLQFISPPLSPVHTEAATCGTPNPSTPFQCSSTINMSSYDSSSYLGTPAVSPSSVDDLSLQNFFFASATPSPVLHVKADENDNKMMQLLEQMAGVYGIVY